ncbi:MAG: type II toxin-antitoxin system HipA family toxin [Psychrobium sp.]|nr:type II toxin-antitoxin system HipA family toxin [Psychrobium sp.]
MNYLSNNKLSVGRVLSDGSRCEVGILAQNKRQVYFQYNDDYLTSFNNLSPFVLDYNSSLQAAPLHPHSGLHGVFSDSLPDGWGLLLMDRIFRQSQILPNQISAMDRLAFVGARAMGALYYEPTSHQLDEQQSCAFSIAELGVEAQAIFDGQTSHVLQALVNAGSSGGARPKAQLYLPKNSTDLCSTSYQRGSDAYLVKFTSAQLSLGHEEGLCEAAYLSMARLAGIEVTDWQLLDAPVSSGAKQWLALKRFDTTVTPEGKEGRIHLHSACGLLGADFRMPSLDYEDLIKASSQLCKSAAAGQEIFRRMIFNLLVLNQDDHSKNWSFLQQDNGLWQLAPFYDVTFSPTIHGEHSTAFSGYGKQPSLKVMKKLAQHAGFSSWDKAKLVIEEVVQSITKFIEIADDLDINSTTSALISKQMNRVHQDNKHWIS